MTSQSKILVKRILLSILTLLIFLFFFITCNLRLVDIEDRYGDLQELYWKSKEGDVVVNNLNSKSAIIITDWHRIYVNIDGKAIALDDWLDQSNKNIYDVVVYRPNHKLKNIKNFSTKESDLVLHLKVKY